MKFKEIVKPALILFLVCLITACALAGTNMLTQEKILQQQVEKANKARQAVLSQAASFEEKDGYLIGKNASGEIEGYVFTTVSKGYGGEITVMTGVLKSGKISAVTILSHSETPGLGANTAKEDFCGQYAGCDADKGVSVTKSVPKAGEIAAVTSATISSKAVTAAVNEALEMYKEIKGE